MVAEQWWVENGTIRIKNPDGTIDTLTPSWYKEQQEVSQHKQYQQAETLKAHLARKRELAEKKKLW